MKHSRNLLRLIDALRALPGVGPKTAQRMAFHLLQEGRPGAHALVQALGTALDSVQRCRRCRMLTDDELCSICAAPQRDPTLLCVVESPADVVAVELSGSYRGYYFVLMGHLSPLDGVGPEELGARELEALLAEGGGAGTHPRHQPHGGRRGHGALPARAGLSRGIQATRIAHGVPVGGELEYVDGGTLAHALVGRQVMG